ncbi:MAG: hypothetical protein KC474_06365 [Cyanobacteria bacterium HKST-UBA04]|nr:hypothetical protein [Cyanobacteria bacterium HKST-UBA04]
MLSLALRCRTVAWLVLLFLGLGLLPSSNAEAPIWGDSPPAIRPADGQQAPVASTVPAPSRQPAQPAQSGQSSRLTQPVAKQNGYYRPGASSRLGYTPSYNRLSPEKSEVSAVSKPADAGKAKAEVPVGLSERPGQRSLVSPAYADQPYGHLGNPADSGFPTDNDVLAGERILEAIFHDDDGDDDNDPDDVIDPDKGGDDESERMPKRPRTLAGTEAEIREATEPKAQPGYGEQRTQARRVETGQAKRTGEPAMGVRQTTPSTTRQTGASKPVAVGKASQLKGAGMNGPQLPVVDEVTPAQLQRRAAEAVDPDNQPKAPLADGGTKSRTTTAVGRSETTPTDAVASKPDSRAVDGFAQLPPTAGELNMYRAFVPKPYQVYQKQIDPLRQTLAEALDYLNQFEGRGAEASQSLPSLQRVNAFYAKARVDWLTLQSEVARKMKKPVVGTPPFETYKLMQTAIEELAAVSDFWTHRQQAWHEYRGTAEESAIDRRVLTVRLKHIQKLLDKVEAIAQANDALNDDVPY